MESPQGITLRVPYVLSDIGAGSRNVAAEVTEIAYDEEFSEDTFRLELTGVEFRRVDR